MWGIMLIRAMGYVCGTKCAMLGLAECGHWDVPLSGRKTLEASGTLWVLRAIKKSCHSLKGGPRQYKALGFDPD